MLDLDALAAAPTCRQCGTQFLGPWCPICRAGAPEVARPMRRVEHHDPMLQVAGRIGRMLRRLGRRIAAARNPRALCPTCFHTRATRCRCGSYAQIDWFGDA